MNPTQLRNILVAIAGGAVSIGVFAAVAAGGAAATAPACLQPATWAMPDHEKPRVVPAAAVVAAMAKRDVVLLGEQHDEEDDHRWQLQMLAALHAQRPDMVIGFEMFPRRAQPVLDRWVAGELTVKDLLAQSEWSAVWRLPPEFYLPLFQFARINRIPMVALNVDQALTRAVAEKGWDAVPEAQREGVGKAAPPSRAYREFLLEVYGDHPPGRGKAGAKSPAADPAFDRFVESQITWDRAMAEGLARRVTARAAGERPLVVGIMGSGHVRMGYGVPHQLALLGVKSVGTLLPVAVGIDCGELRPGLADAVFAMPDAARVAPEPPRLGVRLEEQDGVVRIVDVTAGGLADASGLKAGDLLVDVAGAPVTRMLTVVAAIRLQPAGTWLPLRVKRGDDTLDLVVKFPVKR